MFLALAFPKGEASKFKEFMRQENPSVKLTEFPHSLKEGWVNFNLFVESAYDLYCLGYDFRGFQTADIFSNLDLGETRKEDNG